MIGEYFLNSKLSTYFLDAESLIEVSRLISQERLVTQLVGLLPPSVDGHALHDVLDIGSGPGGWLLDLKEQYPQVRGVGIDTSEKMLTMSSLLSQAEGKVVTFTHMDAREPLVFPDDSFDFVQMRLNHSFLLPPLWPTVLKEVYRVLKIGGWLRVTDLEITLSNKKHTELMYDILPKVWTRVGRSSSPTGRSIGLVTTVSALLANAGFQERELKLYPLELAATGANHTFEKESIALAYTSLSAFFQQNGGYSQEELTETFRQANIEIDQEDYRSVSILLSSWGRKVDQEVRQKE